MEIDLARQSDARPHRPRVSLARAAIPGLALTVPSFLVGGLAGAAVGAGTATWPDVAYLIAPALIALIAAITRRIAQAPRKPKRHRRAAP